jgi:hypothetical protein
MDLLGQLFWVILVLIALLIILRIKTTSIPKPNQK